MDATDGLILFAYDGSDYAKEAIRQAGRQLRTGRPAIVVTIWQRTLVGPLTAGMPLPVFEDDERDAMRVARSGARIAQASGFDAEAVVAEGEQVWRQIVESARAHNAGIIVLGTHGRTGVGHVLLGSVAEAVARHSDVPALIVHAPAANGHPDDDANGLAA
jgi:nucleotide-binding universal stress UspA family protein